MCVCACIWNTWDINEVKASEIFNKKVEASK